MSVTTIPSNPAWVQLRPWRNRNPGDLRTLAHGEMWDGQTGIDAGAGGPFCIFADRVHGWRALAKLLLAYQRLDGCKTLQELCTRFAPQTENNTPAYIRTVSMHAGVTPTNALDLRTAPSDVLEDICLGIAIAEGGSRIDWPSDELCAGVGLALQGT